MELSTNTSTPPYPRMSSSASTVRRHQTRALADIRRAQAASSDEQSEDNAATQASAASAAVVGALTAAPAASHPNVVGLEPDLPSTNLDDRLCLVTVGTTHFDTLLTALNARASDLVSWLLARGFTRLVCQIGTGAVEPTEIRRVAESASQQSQPQLLRVEWFRHSPRLAEWIAASSLVMSHAGAGSVMEALRALKPLLVVVNPTLMHNHQIELAKALADEHHLYRCEPTSVLEMLRSADWTPPIEPKAAAPDDSQSSSSSRYQLVCYPAVQTDAFPTLLNSHADDLRKPANANALVTIALPALLAALATWLLFSN